MPKVTISNTKGLFQEAGSGLTVSSNASLTGKTTLNSCVLKTEVRTGSGACSITVPVTLVDTTGGAAAITLAAGTTAGQVKHIIMVKDSGSDATLTIAASAFAGASNTYVFANVGESLSLLWAVDEDGTDVGWVALSRGTGANASATAVAGLPVASTA